LLKRNNANLTNTANIPCWQVVIASLRVMAQIMEAPFLVPAKFGAFFGTSPYAQFFACKTTVKTYVAIAPFLG